VHTACRCEQESLDTCLNASLNHRLKRIEIDRGRKCSRDCDRSVDRDTRQVNGTGAPVSSAGNCQPIANIRSVQSESVRREKGVAVYQPVHDNNLVASVEKLRYQNAPDITGSSKNQDTLPHLDPSGAQKMTWSERRW